MKRFLPFLIAAVVLIVAAGAGTAYFVWKQRTAQMQAAAIGAEAARSPEKPGAQPPQARGPLDAQVKIEEFADFQCPSCAAVSPALNQAEEKHRGKVCLIFRHFPLAGHEHAQLASRIAEAAGLQGRFWEMHDLLYGSQVLWTRATNPEELFNALAKSAGLDLDRLKKDMESDQVKARIAADQERGTSMGVSRTPAIFINGERVPDSALSQNDLLEAVDQAVNPKAR
jgi:protein-disulfide isomerase